MPGTVGDRHDRQSDRIDVLDHGFVRLDAAEATDLSVVNGARVSFLQIRDEMDDRDAGLIRFLMRMRHRFSSFNEHSLRYSQAVHEFYLPAPEQVRSQVGKPGAYRFEPVDPGTAAKALDLMERMYGEAWSAYTELTGMGVAKELARLVLPVGLYTEFYWSVNARSLMNFVSLRNADAAMWEIRQYAEAVERFFAERMPATHAAFVEYGRVAP
jgi:thymidylate synthase (FAD)